MSKAHNQRAMKDKADLELWFGCTFWRVGHLVLVPWNDWISKMIPLILYHNEFWPSQKTACHRYFCQIKEGFSKGFFANRRLSKKGSLPNNVSPNSHLHPIYLPLIKPNRLLSNSFWYFQTKIQSILKSLKSYSKNSILWQSLPLLELHGIAFGSWNAWFVRQCSSFLHLASGVKSRPIPAKNKNI